MTVYDFLLQSSLTSGTRIIYLGDKPLHSKQLPGPVRHKVSYTTRKNQEPFTGVKIPGKGIILDAECDIQLMDLDALLYLAGTCRLIRSELLALAWSHADISINSPTLYMDLHYIFYDRLSSNACAFIRVLQVSVGQYGNHGK
jgi:hypothetical protein